MANRLFRFAVSSSSTGSGSTWTALAQRAEELGYATLHVSDHYQGVGANGGQELAAVPAMAAAAAVTSTLRVGARVMCIDYKHPVVLAKEAATIDKLSDGRLELGLGAGWVASEYESMGLAMDDAPTRVDRLAEYIAFFKAFFAGGDVTMQGKHVNVTELKAQPSVVQQPHPPLIIGGGSPRVLRLAGAEADIVSFNFDNRAGVVGPAGVASSGADAMDNKVRWVREGAGDRFDGIELEVGAYFTVVTPDAAAADATGAKMGEMFGLDGAAMIEHPNSLIGTVDDIVDRLQHRRDRYGFSYVTVSDRNMEAFAPVVARLVGQ
jgi:probable F420-dependent oxidoreductase